jgi:hypothetical protein
MESLSEKINRWNAEKKKKKVSKKEQAASERRGMIAEYPHLIVSYGDRSEIDGSWPKVIECDLHDASIVLGRRLVELYLGLQQNKGYLRTLRYEVRVKP